MIEPFKFIKYLYDVFRNKYAVNGSFTCPCCGYLSFSEPPGSYSICPICFWEDDEVMLRFPEMSGGANKVSLIEGQQNFINIGACEERIKEYTRKPTMFDKKDKNWRTINSKIDKFPSWPGGDKGLEYPDEDRRKLYYWRENFWMNHQKINS